MDKIQLQIDLELIYNHYKWMREDPQIQKHFQEITAFALLSNHQMTGHLEILRVLEDTSERLDANKTGIYEHAAVWLYGHTSDGRQGILFSHNRWGRNYKKDIWFEEMSLDRLQHMIKLTVVSDAKTALQKLGLYIDIKPLSDEDHTKLTAIASCNKL